LRAGRLNINHQIRFRRWSRARYAAFASLKGNVTVGVVKSSIADISLQKSCISNSYQYKNCLFSDDTLFEPDGLNKELNALILENIFSINEIVNNSTYIENQNFIISNQYNSFFDA
jgi:hypothetical protein